LGPTRASSFPACRFACVSHRQGASPRSPDERSLAVEKLVADRSRWQVAVIDLATWTERDLPQGPTSVDDQVEWLDDHHVMYHGVDGGSTSLWILPADGGGDPAVLLKHAYSGALER
jgi:hypothetical protein